MKPLNDSTVERRHRRVNILQFGEGNFLRAFADWMFDIANEKGVADIGVAIMKPREGHSSVIDKLISQDCLYNVCLEGIENGQPAKKHRLITVVEDAFTPGDTDKYNQYILSPELRFVVSNTTEAGIRYENDDIAKPIPATFPGKIAALLLRRYRHFNGDISKGLLFLCCELIEENGAKLKQYVLRHAAEAKVEDGFRQWVEEACVFADTLVDRIVSGRPDNMETVQQETGCQDELPVCGELYHLWVIGGKGVETIRRELPLDLAGLNVVYLPSIKEFRDKKVRILNGTHTGMAAIALLSGIKTVAEAITDRDIYNFIISMLENEVVPAIGGDADELRRFYQDTVERFRNPYIHHLLQSIALNSLSKWETRNFPTVRDLWNKNGKLATHELFTFAALLALYAPDSGFKPEDNTAHIDYIRTNWNDKDLTATVKSIVSHSGIFTTDFDTAVPGFVAGVSEQLADIRLSGVDAALKNFLKRYQ